MRSRATGEQIVRERERKKKATCKNTDLKWHTRKKKEKVVLNQQNVAVQLRKSFPGRRSDPSGPVFAPTGCNLRPPSLIARPTDHMIRMHRW